MSEHVTRARAGVLGGLAHVLAVGVFVVAYVSVSGHEFSLPSFVDGGIPLAVLFVLGAACALAYSIFDLVSPSVLIAAFDVLAVLSSPPEVWTDPGPAGPPSVYGFYVFLFVIPLGVAGLVGVVEYFLRRRWGQEPTRSSS